MILSLLSFAAAVICYTIGQIQQHGKISWSKDAGDFWSGDSWTRKYKSYQNNGVDIVDAPNTWYYRFFKIKYKERFPGSATIFVAFTDGYHFCQFWFFNFLSLSLTFAIGFNWWLLLGVWSLIRVVHFVTYRLLQR